MGKNSNSNKKQLKTSSKVDLLREDPPIAGQKFACLSFISPDKILKQKEIFMFEQFLRTWDYNKSMEKFVQFLNFISFKYNLNFDTLSEDLKEFVESEKKELMKESIEDEYKTFLDKNEEDLEKKFNKEHDFQTSVRGLMVRGVFPSQEEAELRCKVLRDIDNSFDILVGPVGMWLPWDPDAYKTGKVEYLEDELNQLMHEKKKNDMNAKAFFEQRIRDAKEKAIEDNIKMAEKTGNKLTQNIDEEGNLIGVVNDETTDISSADIHKQLFDGNNIVTGKTDYGRSQLVSGPFATKK